jgi:hypothetical protein
MKINEELKKEYYWRPDAIWEARMSQIIKIIPEGSRVLDLGGGMCHLYYRLKNCDYLSIDIKPWTDLTVVADFNKNEYPEVGRTFTYLVAQGIIEYIEKPKEFLEGIKKYGEILLLTYRKIEGIKYHHKKIAEIIKQSGWEVIFKKKVEVHETLFYCRKYDTCINNQDALPTE